MFADVTAEGTSYAYPADLSSDEARTLWTGQGRVVVAVDDPTPVATGGIGTLRAAGVQVETGVRRAEAETRFAAESDALDTRTPLVPSTTASPSQD